MANELYELLRILVYPFGALGLFYLGVIKYKLRPVFFALSFYFIIWFGLLIVQTVSVTQYRSVSNFISTPALMAIVLVIYINLYKLRRE